MPTETETPDTYIETGAYARLVRELAGLPFLPREDVAFDGPTWAVEFLAVAGVWPETCRETESVEASASV